MPERCYCADVVSDLWTLTHSDAHRIVWLLTDLPFLWPPCAGVPHGSGCYSWERPDRLPTREPALWVSQNRLSSQTSGDFSLSPHLNVYIICHSLLSFRAGFNFYLWRQDIFHCWLSFTQYDVPLLSRSTVVWPYSRTSRTSLQVLHWEALRAEWQFTISIHQTREWSWFFFFSSGCSV